MSELRVLERDRLWQILTIITGHRARTVGLAIAGASNKITGLAEVLTPAEAEALKAYLAPVEWYELNCERLAIALPLRHKGITYQPGAQLALAWYVEHAHELGALFDGYIRGPMIAIAAALVEKEQNAIAAVAAKENAA